ncbi:MAG TPA: S8 family serine peptidase, partial [Candidatus Obscuribacterales bacterium]
MKRLVRSSLQLALALLASSALSACNRPPLLTAPGQSFRRLLDRHADQVPGQLVVQFRSRPTPTYLQQFARQNGLQALRISPLGAGLFRSADPEGSLQQLSRDPMVEYSHPNFRYRHFFTVNDPRSAEQSGLAVIGAARAWDLTLGDPRVTIAIVDSGADLQHPDLKANLVPGYNVLSQGQTPPQDDNGHGTHASGIAAAVTDNHTGVAGACPRCRLMPVKALDSNGDGNGFDVAVGVVWAVDN